MNKLINLLVSLMMCVLILLTACGTPSPSLPSELRAPNTDYPKSIDILVPYFFPSSSDEIKQQWLDEMSQHYGVTLNIISDDYTDPGNVDHSASSKVQDVLMGDTTYNGLFLISDDGSYDSDLSIGVDSDSIVPLEDYLADNPVWNALPDDFKSLFEVDGHIYAIPPGGNEYTPFAYDPTEGCYVDFMTKSAAVEAFEYLRELYKAGSIYLSPKDELKFTSGLIASKYRKYSNYYNYTEIFTLNPEYPQIANFYKKGFAMTKNTPQPKETINFLVYMLFGSEQNYLDCWLGSSKNYVLNSDGTITIKMVQNSEGKYVSPGMPNLTGGLSDIFPYSDATIYYSQNGVTNMDSNTDMGRYNAFLKQQYDLIKNGTVVEIPLKYLELKSPTYDANMTDVGIMYSDYFKKAITSSDQTVQQILEEYKAKMLNMSGNQMLDEMNAAIGKKTAYYYG